MVSQSTVNTITLLLLPIAILMIVYALYIYYMRSKYIEQKQVKPQLSRVPPLPVVYICHRVCLCHGLHKAPLSDDIYVAPCVSVKAS